MSNHPLYIPPYPEPRAQRPSLLERLKLGRQSWLSVFFGKSYSMKMGQFKVPLKTFFVVNQPDLVRRILIDDADQYPKNRLLYQMLTLLVGDGIFISNGPVWQKQRQMMEQALSVSHIKNVFPLMQDAVEVLLQRVDALDLNRPLNLSEEMAHITADIIFRTIFSKPLSLAESQIIFKRFALYQRVIANAAPILFAGLPVALVKPWAAPHAQAIRAVIADNIRPRFDAYQRGQPQAEQDILAALLAATDPKTGQHFSFEELIDQIAVLFLAGHETSAATLSWAFYILAHCPHLQQQMTAEVEQVLAVTGQRQLQHGDIKKLKHTTDVFKETLRLYPPVGGFMREATQAVCMRDKQIQPKDVVMVLPWLLHRRADLWPNTHAFQPERFRCPQQKDVIRQTYYPYGAGQRVCIGAAFANQEAILILATLVSRYQFEPVAGKAPQPVGHITIKPDRHITLRLRRRSTARD